MNREKIHFDSKMEFIYISKGEHNHFSLIKESSESYTFYNIKNKVNDIIYANEFIIKRFSDGKFFKGVYTKTSDDKNFQSSFNLIEVFEKTNTQETITVTYE